MKKAIWILSILLFISILVIASLLWWHKLATSKIIQENDIILQNKEKLLLERQETIDRYIKNPLTIETVKYLSSSEKDKRILELQDGIKEISEADGIIINDLYERLNKTNEALKAKVDFKNSISAFLLAGLDRQLEIDIYAGLKYRRVIFSLPKMNMFAGFGGAVKIYQDLGGALELELGFSF